MRTRRVAAVGVIAVLIAIAGIAWLELRGDDAPKPHDPWASPPVTGPTEAEILAKKRAARGGAPVDTTPGSIAGRVTRKADGTGVAGAVVSIAIDQIGGNELPGGGAVGDEVVAIADTTGAWVATGIAPGTYVVTAAAPGLLPAARAGVMLAPRAAQRGVDLVLEAGGAIVSGTVSDIGGGPIADARVRVAREDVLAFKGSPTSFVAITDGDGTYQHTLLPGGWEATASHADYAPASRDFELRATPLTLDFTLTPGGSVSGRVVARGSGEPVPGALVIGEGGRTGAGGRWGEDSARSAITDAAGRFTIAGLGSGAISLHATGKGFATTAPVVVELGIGEHVTDIEILADRAFTVSGFVVAKGEAATGIPGVRVGVFAISEREHAFALQPSGPDGYFEIHGVRPASYMAYAIGGDVMPDLGKTVLVEDRDVTDVLIVMETGVTLAGRVEPAGPAQLSLEIDPSKIGLGNLFDMMKSQLAVTRAGADGTFALRNAPDGDYTLLARADDGSVGKLPVTIDGVDQAGLVVRLEPRASIEGRVIDAARAPVVGARVAATRTSKAIAEFSISSAMSGGGVVTGPDGAFRVIGLDPGTYTLQVSDELGPLAWADPAAGAAPIEVPASGVSGLTLVVEARDGVIRGVVLGGDRAPAADAWVTATFSAKPLAAVRAAGGGGDDEEEEDDGDDGDGDDGDDGGDDLSGWRGVGPQRPVLTGPDGRFTISGLRRGAYEVVAEGDKGRARARREGVKTGDSVTLVLDKLGSLAGVVTVAGAPVADYSIECDGPGGEQRRRVAAADGAYAFERLPPGTYRCTATAAAGTATGEATVANAPARLDLALGAWGAVAGRAIDARTSAALAGLKLMVTGVADEGEGAASFLTGGGPTTDASGRFEVGKCTAGTGHLVIFDAGMASFEPLATRDFELAAGQRLDLGDIRVVPKPAGPPGYLGLVLGPDDDALVIASVADGGPARAAGLAAGDRVIAVDGLAVADLGADVARRLVEQTTVGQVVAFGIERAGARHDISVTAVAPPAP